MFFFLRQGIFFVIPLSRAGRMAARMMCQPFGPLPTRPTSEVGEAVFSARVSRFLSSFIEPPFRSLVCPGALPVSAPLPPGPIRVRAAAGAILPRPVSLALYTAHS